MVRALSGWNTAKGDGIVTVQLMTAPASREAADAPRRAYADDLDLDTIDGALDQGDLETVRRYLGLDRRAWYWLLRNL